MSDFEYVRHRLNELKERIRPMREEALIAAADGDDPIAREIADNLITGRMTPREVMSSSFYSDHLRGGIEAEETDDPEGGTVAGLRGNEESDP